MAQPTRKPPIVSNSTWIHRDFFKEKLRVRERYWRPAHALQEEKGERDVCWILPDGVVWRKYLPLLSHLVDKHVAKLVLLESAVELMDYRNTSPCISIEDGGQRIPESSALQERTKIQKLIQNHPQHVLPFCDLSIRDEECDEWDIMSYAEMSIAERSRHAVVRAGRMIQQQHLGHNSQILLLCSDADFASQFPSEGGIETLFVDNFLDYLVLHGLADSETMEKLLLLKTRCEEEYRHRNAPSSAGPDINDEHYTVDQAQEGLKKGVLVQGRLTVTKENPREASVVGHGGETYFVNQQLGHFNRAFHQDIVILKPLPQSQWGRPVGRRRLVYHRDDDDDYVPSLEVDASPPVPSARVVAFATPARRQFVATMVDTPMNDESACLVVPMDIRIPKIRVKTNAWRRFVNQRLLIEVDGWELGSNYPQGRCIDILGPIADLETEISCLLHENEVQLDPFSAAALACLPPEGPQWKIPPEEIAKRRDLRKSHRIFSVDPPGCQDIDDTMHARVLTNGDIEVGVHIADVTYFVPHNSPLDIEAQVRGTTFYLVDRRFDMLPSLLSSDLCSLHGKTDRLAVSAMWTMSKDFKQIKSVWYGRTVIHNFQAMTYEQAHNILHDKPPDEPGKPRPPPLTAGAPVDRASIEPLKHDLNILTNLARKLRKDREQIGGAVDLSSGDLGSELKFTLDGNNNPTRVTPKKEMEIHHTIAEMMILANSWVATTIHKSFPRSALLRIHRSVDEGRFEDLKEVLNAGKIAFDGSSNMSLAKSLKQAETGTKTGGTVNALFRSLATRAMSEAQYVCTGALAGESALSHYGLGLERYTHFTSPIRRYADVVVHKQLLASLDRELKTARPAASLAQRAVRQEPIANLPQSKVISILVGGGLQEVPKSEFVTIDSTGSNPDGIGGSHHLVPDVTSTMQIDAEMAEVRGDCDAPYVMQELTKVCEGLNTHNRMAKLSSMECQSLFLSLYFKDHTETTQAVVTNLRANGFWVYVPRFDMRGPVYLTDAEGALQIDPALLGLGPGAGTPPTLGFAASMSSRRFPVGKCDLSASPDEHLEVSVPEGVSPFVVRTLDVVTVQLCCDTWDTRSRVPLPRLHLVGPSVRKVSPSQMQAPTISVNSNTLQQKNRAEAKANVHSNKKSASLYDVLRIDTPPVLVEVPLRPQTTKKPIIENRKTTIFGRLVFGDFINPDTRSAVQDAAIEAASEAAEQRRAQVMATRARVNEYDSTRRIEADVTARTQRLAAGKRSTRKAKGK